MSVITVQDLGGHVIPLFQHQGNNYGNIQRKESIINIKTVPIRDDDVFICSYPKSGLHWTWDTTRMILAGRLLHDTSEVGASHLEYASHDWIKSLPSPRLLSSHCRLRLLPPDIARKGCKIIYLIRNPKDMVVSYYNFIRHLPFYNYKGKWEDYMEPCMLGKFAYGSWFDHVLSWEEEMVNYPNISVFYFEDMKENPFREIQRLDRFLCTNRSEQFLSDLCGFTTFSKMSQRKETSSVEDGAFPKTYRKDLEQEDDLYRQCGHVMQSHLQTSFVAESVAILNLDAIRVKYQSEVGDWRNWFTVAQNEWFDHLYCERMKETDFKIRFSLQ